MMYEDNDDLSSFFDEMKDVKRIKSDNVAQLHDPESALE